jgi:UDP-N-acetyl-D-mannosaminuronic acid transferase (WecB/TagA/CpsF family)
MYEHRAKLKVPVMLGVGTFDNSGKLRRAPVWMQDLGLGGSLSGH